VQERQALAPVFEPVKELPNPLIPADARIQTLPNAPTLNW
jgi:hypothetical protein